MKMPSPSRQLVQAGLALKIAHVRRATAAYFRNRADQAIDTASAYVIAAVCWCAMAFFITVTVLAGLAALFRVQLNVGEFQVFGAVAGATLCVALICAIIAILALKKNSKPVASLPSRLRVAIASPPIPRTMISQANSTTNKIPRDDIPGTTPSGSTLPVSTWSADGHNINRQGQANSQVQRPRLGGCRRPQGDERSEFHCAAIEGASSRFRSFQF
jgi:hypothetical protein